MVTDHPRYVGRQERNGIGHRVAGLQPLGLQGHLLGHLVTAFVHQRGEPLHQGGFLVLFPDEVVHDHSLFHAPGELLLLAVLPGFGDDAHCASVSRSAVSIWPLS